MPRFAGPVSSLVPFWIPPLGGRLLEETIQASLFPGRYIYPLGFFRMVSHTCGPTLSDKQAQCTLNSCCLHYMARCLLNNLAVEQRTSNWISFASRDVSLRVKIPRPFTFSLSILRVPRHPATVGTTFTLHPGWWMQSADVHI